MDEQVPPEVAARSAEPANEVRLRGRVAAAPVPRSLPSGAEIVGFRLVVERSATVMTRGSRQKSDWIDCTAWSSPNRRKALSWQPGDVVEVEGSFRRRHYRGETGGGSLVEIEMLGGRRVNRPALAAGA